VKMMSEVMKTISRPCAIRLTRNSRINIEKSYLAFHQRGARQAGAIRPAGAIVRPA
jgi:hypothetical protein